MAGRTFQRRLRMFYHARRGASQVEARIGDGAKSSFKALEFLGGV
jgi:hypothetical protein